MIPVAEFAPDQPTLSQSCGHVENVIPLTSNSYGPVGTFATIGSALASRAQGAGSFRGPNGIVFNCAGDAGNLYAWTGATWANVSRATGGAYATEANEGWAFAQFGDRVVAVNGIDAPQCYNIALGGVFGPLPGSPPVARFAAPVRDFLFLGQLAAAENKIRWSTINDVTAWAIGIGQADEQEFPEGGRVMGLAGGQHAIVFQESAIQRGTYVGPDLIFQFDNISRERGCAASGSIASYQEMTFFLAADGFFLLTGGQGEQPIGDQRVDRWFWDNVNQAFLHRITATVDPKAKLYLMAFPSTQSPNGAPDTILAYSWTIGRWSKIAQSVDLLFAAMNGMGLSLEAMDSVSASIDALPYSLDSSLAMGSPLRSVAGFGADRRLGFFAGPAMAATIDTVEGEITPGQRTFVRALRPLVDGGSPLVALGSRDRINDAIAWSSDVQQATDGQCPTRSNARYHRARLRMPAGQTWGHILGVDIDAVEAGSR